MGIKFQEATTEDTQTQLQAQRNLTRDEDLKALDAITEPKVKEWEAAGKPVATVANEEGDMVQNPFAVYIRLAVPKDQVADFKQNMVRRSALLYGCDPVYYANQPDAEGFTAVKWTFADHETEAQKKKRLAELAKMEAAEKATQEGTQEGEQPQGDGDQESPQGEQPQGEQPQSRQRRGLLNR